MKHQTGLERTRTYTKDRKAHHVWAFGRLLVQASIWWMVKSRGPAAPAKQARVRHVTTGARTGLRNLGIKLVRKPQGLGMGILVSPHKLPRAAGKEPGFWKLEMTLENTGFLNMLAFQFEKKSRLEILRQLLSSIKNQCAESMRQKVNEQIQAQDSKRWQPKYKFRFHASNLAGNKRLAAYGKSLSYREMPHQGVCKIQLHFTHPGCLLSKQGTRARLQVHFPHGLLTGALGPRYCWIRYLSCSVCPPSPPAASEVKEAAAPTWSSAIMSDITNAPRPPTPHGIAIPWKTILTDGLGL